MFYCVGIFFLLVAVCSTLDQPPDISGHQGRARQKRGFYTIGAAVLRAIKATKEVMRGATPVAGEVNSIFYTKAGDFSKAMKDFEKFEPDDIHGFLPSKGGKGIWAEVGDRTITLQQSGDAGTPMLQIIQGLGTSRELIHKINYTN